MSWTRNLRLRQLQMLERLCALRNLSQVATEFNLTQPALSKWLKDFEDSVGAPLFERHARGVEPLPLALELARHARGINGRLNRAQASIEQLKRRGSAHLAVGFSPMTALVYLPDILRAFRQRHADTFVQVQEATLDRLMPRLQHGELDLLVGRIEDTYYPMGFEIERLRTVELCLAVCPQHPLAQLDKFSWAEALRYPWVAPPSSSPIRQQMRLAFDTLGIDDPPVMVESAYMATTARLILGTDFVVPMSKDLAQALGMVQALELPQPHLGMEASVGLIWRQGERPEVVQTFLECIRAVLQL